MSVDAGKACQQTAMVLVSIALLLVVVAACVRDPTTGKLGVAVSMTLVMFAIFQVAAFSCMASFTRKGERRSREQFCPARDMLAASLFL